MRLRMQKKWTEEELDRLRALYVKHRGSIHEIVREFRNWCGYTRSYESIKSALRRLPGWQSLREWTAAGRPLIVEQAERAVAAVSDPELKRAAFEKVLDDLLARADEPTDDKVAKPTPATPEEGQPLPPPLAESLPDDPRFRQAARLLHPAPFAVEHPAVALPREGEAIVTGLIYGDTHGQFISPTAESVLFAVAKDYQPGVVIHVGDAVDCYTLSDFDKSPYRRESFQDEINAARTHLAKMRAVVPNSTFYLLEGNHERRLLRSIFRSTGPMREIAKLDAFVDAITWPRLLQLDALGIEWVPIEEQTKQKIFPKFIVKHGSVVRKWSAWSAKGEWEKYGRSGASGHVHRLGVFMHRDHNGNHVWSETGCLCDLEPEYMQDPDWQNGFLVVTFERETGAFQMEPVYIHHGSALWRGKRYVAEGSDS